MTRNFTAMELRQHRDNTVTAVREGRLVENSEPTETFEVMLNGILGAILPSLAQPTAPSLQLLPEAVEVLLAAVGYGGRMIEITHDGGWIPQCVPDAYIPQNGAEPHRMRQFGNGADYRTQALYRNAFEQLVKTGIVERAKENQFDVSHDGYLLADQLIAAEQLHAAQSETAP